MQPQYAPPQQIPPASQGNQAVPLANTQLPHNHHEKHDLAPFDYQQTEEKLETIMNRLNSLQGMKRSMYPKQYCIVSDLERPRNFKILDFEKYDGISDPHIHVSMYHSRMGAYIKNEKMLMYYFQ